LVLVGIEDGDNQEDIDWLVNKITNIRIFWDEDIMNLSRQRYRRRYHCGKVDTYRDVATKKGNRPFIKASKPEIAIPLYENLVLQLEKNWEKKVQTGT
jgi:D-tyrosyl-tRNA(Tyr) deacylase